METFIFLGIVVFVAVGMLWLVVARGFALKRLMADGVEAKGTVLRQFKSQPRGPQSTTNHFIRYGYRDDRGRSYEYKSQVARDFWVGHPEGAAIDIVYSKSKPSVSAPRFLVEQAREAMKGKAVS